MGGYKIKLVHVETRTAYAITEMIKMYGEEAEDIAMLMFY